MKNNNNGLQSLSPKLAGHRLSHYLFDITDVWATGNPVPPKQMVEYAGSIRAMAGRAAEVGELEALRRDIELLIRDKAVDAGPLVARAFRYTDGEARQLLGFVSLLIWRLADSVLPGASPDVVWQDNIARKHRRSAIVADPRTLGGSPA